jgi:hypothetical protein
MSEKEFKSAIADTLANLFSAAKDRKAKNTLDHGAFLTSIKKELIKNDLPFFSVSRSKVNKNIIILELPFCKECEISITPTMFGSTKNEAAIKINGILTRRIRLEQLDSLYMNQVAIALIDYLKRFLIVKNKIITNK